MMSTEPTKSRAVTGSTGEVGNQQRINRVHCSGSSRRKRCVPKATLTRFQAEDNRIFHEAENAQRQSYTPCSSARCTPTCIYDYTSCETWMQSHNKEDNAIHDVEGFKKPPRHKSPVLGHETGNKYKGDASSSLPLKTRVVSSTRSLRVQLENAMTDDSSDLNPDEARKSRSFPYDIRKGFSPLLSIRTSDASPDSSPVGTRSWLSQSLGLSRPSDTKRWPGATDKSSLAQARENVKLATKIVSGHVRKATGRRGGIEPS